MKKLLALLVLASAVSFTVHADQIDDLFAGGEDREFEFERFSENNVMKAISADAGIACHKGLCKLTSVDTKWKEFSINMNGGMGNNASGGFGGFGDGNGTFINLGNQPNSVSFQDKLHANINMQIKVGTCTRSINIPRSLYYAINRYMYGLMNEDSTTMIMFYTTVMKQADGCK